MKVGKSIIHDPQLVLTPLGYRRKEKVIKVKRGHRVHMHSAGWKVFDRNDALILDTTNDILQKSEPFPLSSPWVSYGEMVKNSNAPFSLVSSVWTVPPAPLNNSGQTIYLFNGLQHVGPNGQPDYILQPVLLYGQYPDGENGEKSSNGTWMIASFWVPYSQDEPVFISSDVIPVAPGTSLTGTMRLKSQNSGNGTVSYECFFNDYPGTMLSMVDVPRLDLCDQTLEIYGVNDRNQLPLVQYTAFTNLIAEINGVQISDPWIAEGECKAVVKRGAGSSGEVDVVYPN